MSSKKPAAEEDQAEPKKKSPMMMIIIIVVAVVLLGGGGFFAYSKFFKSSHSAEGSAESGAHAAPHVEAPVIHEWDSFLVNLADPGGKRYLKVNVKMELTSPQAQAEFTTMDIPLRDAMLTLLSSKEYEDISTPGGKQSLKQEIAAMANKILKQGKVKDVYFTDFLVQ